MNHIVLFFVIILQYFWAVVLAIAVAKRVKFCAIYYTLQPEFVPRASRLSSLFLRFIL